jgi:hypothetical protein
MHNIVPIDFFGHNTTYIKELSDISGIAWTTLKRRYKAGYRDSDLITPPHMHSTYFDGRKMPMRVIFEKTGIPRGTLSRRKSEGKTGADLYKEHRTKVYFKGQRTTFAALSRIYGINQTTLRKRYLTGLRDDELVAQGRTNGITFKGKETTFKELSKKTGLSVTLLSKRYQDGLRDDELIAPALPRKYIAVTLTAKDVIEIKKHLKNKTMIQRELANAYGVSIATISAIKCGKRWSEVTI